MRIKVQAASAYGFFRLFVIYLDSSAISNNFLLSENAYKIYAKFVIHFQKNFHNPLWTCFPGARTPLKNKEITIL
jgi:hypothetical protein